MKEYEKGIISGIGQTLSGHPFDTLKVIRQNKLFLFDIFKNILSKLSTSLARDFNFLFLAN